MSFFLDKFLIKMALKRKTRNLPNMNDNEKMNQVNRIVLFFSNYKNKTSLFFFKMSFFEPVYQNDGIQMNDDESDGELSVNSLSRRTFRDKNQDESNETLQADPRTNSSSRNEDNDTLDQDQSLEVIRKNKQTLVLLFFVI
jgi:hypothetical protein